MTADEGERMMSVPPDALSCNALVATTCCNCPLHDGNTRNELTYYLPAGWDAVVEKDIDGDRAETTELENKEPRFGQVNAARRVARTLFLGSAPSSVAGKSGIRGLDRARVLLGCLQPGQTSATYSDALNRLADRLHYLNSSGDKAQDTTRFWFDTRANLRREMEDRKRRFEDGSDVRGKIAEALKKMVGSATFFDGVHIFTPHGDVPDDSALRLVVLSPDHWYSRDEERQATNAVLDYVRNNGTKPRYRGNRLVFLAPDMAILNRLRDVARTALACNSIVEDVKEGRLNIDLLQKKQAEKELQNATEVVPRAARECYKWLLCPVQNTATDPKPTVETFPLTSSGGSAGSEIERVCIDNELVITTWSPIHLRTKLKELYWKDGKTAAGAMAFWEDSLRYLYLSRLKNRDSLVQAIRTGAASKDFFGIAYGQSGDTYEGFHFGDGNVQVDDTLLLIEPEAAKLYEASIKKPAAGGAVNCGCRKWRHNDRRNNRHRFYTWRTGGHRGYSGNRHNRYGRHDRSQVQDIPRLHSNQSFYGQNASGSGCRGDHQRPCRRSECLAQHYR